MERYEHHMATLLRALVLAAVACAAAGCATAPSANRHASAVAARGHETTEARVARIFRYQSRVADALLDRYPLREDFVSADPALVAAEARMNDQCAAVTRVVVNSLEGDSPSLVQRLFAMRSLHPCERATRRVERLLGTQTQASVLAISGRL